MGITKRKKQGVLSINMIKACQEKLAILVGRRCLGVVAGSPNRQVIQILLGETVDSADNDSSRKGAKFSGMFILGVYCDWRLQKHGRPITGSCEPDNIDGPLVRGVQQLAGETVTAVEVTDECGDINLRFGDTLLKVFCTYTGNEDEEYYPQWDVNWYLDCAGKRLAEVQKGCRIVIYDSATKTRRGLSHLEIVH